MNIKVHKNILADLANMCVRNHERNPDDQFQYVDLDDSSSTCCDRLINLIFTDKELPNKFFSVRMIEYDYPEDQSVDFDAYSNEEYVECLEVKQVEVVVLQWKEV